MVHISLKVFDSPIQTKYAAIRGLIAFFFLFIINLVYLYLIKSTSHKFSVRTFFPVLIAYTLSLILIAFIIAIQIPSDDNEVPPTTQFVTFGIVVGIVLYGMVNIMLYVLIKYWSAPFAIRYTAFGITSVTLASLFTFYLSNKFMLY